MEGSARLPGNGGGCIGSPEGFSPLSRALFAPRAARPRAATPGRQPGDEQPGLGGSSKTLEPMAVGAASYGNYVKLQVKTSYLVTVRVQTPGSTRTVEAKFDHRAE